MRWIIWIFICTAFSCAAPTPEQPKAGTSDSLSSRFSWTKLADSAAFPRSYNFQLMNIRDTVWVLHSAGIFTSSDGIHYTKSGLENILGNTAFLDYVYFKDELWALGRFTGNIESFTFKSSIWSTADLRHWQVRASQSNLPPRFFIHPFVFNGRIWIIGGTDGKTVFADAWNSVDGIHWDKVADSLPFGKKENVYVVTFRKKLVLLSNDVWESVDGIHWNLLAKDFGAGSVYGYFPVVYENRIWLLGTNRNNQFTQELLVSSDGVHWTSSKAPWSPRGGVAACIFRNGILMTGGKYGGQSGQEFIYSNDIWMLRTRRDPFRNRKKMEE